MMLTAQCHRRTLWAAVLLLVNDEDGRMFIQFPVPAAIRQDIHAGCEKPPPWRLSRFWDKLTLETWGLVKW